LSVGRKKAAQPVCCVAKSDILSGKIHASFTKYILT
jgi:hypothetical protein